MEENQYEDTYVQALFDRMGRTYDTVNLISSFGFSALWRRRCVQDATVRTGDRVCDLMAGSGECWPYLFRAGAQVVSIDFSPVMFNRQVERKAKVASPVDVLLENALSTSLPEASVDCVIAAFGLKTLRREAISRLAVEIRRILRPDGRFSLIEISEARNWSFGSIYRWYVRAVIPIIGKVCLGDIECYRMLGSYTKAFGSCEEVAPLFSQAGLDVSVREHFFGCATSLVGRRRDGA